MKIRSLIVDDDPFIRETLRDMLLEHFPEIELLDDAISGTDGIDKIESLSPDLLFLDVQLRDMTGFEMLSRLRYINFQTIFITSYSHYAIRAIRFSALDYLLKPIDLKELRAAIRRFTSAPGPQDNSDKVEVALKNMNTPDPEYQTLVISEQKGDLKVTLKNIIRLEGERNYTYIYLTDGKKRLVSKTLGELEELLASQGFYRAHKSYLVNRNHIEKITGKTFILMSDGQMVPIARRRLTEFRAWFGADS